MNENECKNIPGEKTKEHLVVWYMHSKGDTGCKQYLL